MSHRARALSHVGRDDDGKRLAIGAGAIGAVALVATVRLAVVASAPAWTDMTDIAVWQTLIVYVGAGLVTFALLRGRRAV